VIVAAAIVLACAAGGFALASDGGGKPAVKRASTGSGPIVGGGQVWISGPGVQSVLVCIADATAGRIWRTPSTVRMSVDLPGHGVVRVRGPAPRCR
jgi:hypothetical protein